MVSRQSARWVGGVLACLALAVAIGVPGRAGAAPPAQFSLSFDDRLPSTGTLDANTPQMRYSFTCAADGVGSVIVKTVSGDLVADVAVLGPDGAAFATGSVVSGAPSVTVAEAFVMPSSGQCAVVLSRTGNTAGAYEVRLLPGYARLDVWDEFDGAADPLRQEWEPYQSETMNVSTVSEQLRIQVTTDDLLAYAVPTGDDLVWTDLYIQADYVIDGAPSYFEYGFVLRLAAEVEEFYTVTYSSDGDYSVYYFNGEWNPIQEWTVSPVVDGSDQRPRAAVWLRGDTFRLYFNGQFVAEVVDAANYATKGTIALAAVTGVDQLDPLTVYMDNLVITRPYQIGAAVPLGGQDATQPTPTPAGLLGILGATKPPAATPTPKPTLAPVATPTVPPTSTPQPAFPQKLRSWVNNRPQEVVAELREAGVVPAGGSVTFSVPSSYGDTSAAGWSYFPLGQGRTFRNFVLSFDARLVAGGPEAGCGMFFRDSATTNNSATITEDGWALLGEWDTEGNLLDTSVFDQFDAVIQGIGATNRATVVMIEETALMYVNGELVAAAEFTPATGGLALEIYVQADESGATVETYCQLNNIWLWEF